MKRFGFARLGAGLVAVVTALWVMPAAAASGPTLQANPGHGTAAQQFTASYTPSAADCQSPPMDVVVLWDGIEIGRHPMDPCPAATTLAGLAPAAGTPQNPANRAGWHQLSAHIEMPGNQALASESNAVTRYFLDPSGDAALALNPGHAHWYENFTLTYTAPTGFACKQRMLEFRADGVGSSGTLLVRQYLHCPTTSNTASFSNLRVAGAHTIWAYVIDDSSWEDVPGTEAYAQFTVDPGDPPQAPPAPPLSNTGGGGAQPSTGGSAPGPAAGHSSSQAAPAHQSSSQAPAAAAPVAPDHPGAGAADALAGPTTSKVAPSTPLVHEPEGAASVPATLARVLTTLSRREAAVPTAAAGLVVVLVAWVSLGATGVLPPPLSLVRRLVTRLRNR